MVKISVPKKQTIVPSTLTQHIVTPGEIISTDPLHMRGHGTIQHEESTLIASVSGIVEKTNKLISVKSFRSRYQGEIGDIVVGRITEVGQSRWKVDIASRQDAILLLSSVHLPGGVQRRKSESDALKMRQFFNEGDLVSCEVQQFFNDGAASLHTRSIKYGKLRNGSLMMVPSSLIKRSKSHFIQLPFGVDIILGLNGYIWVSMHINQTEQQENDLLSLYSNENQPIPLSIREIIARTCNCISVIYNYNIQITDTTIVYAYEISISCSFSVVDILNDENSKHIASAVKNELDSSREM